MGQRQVLKKDGWQHLTETSGPLRSPNPTKPAASKSSPHGLRPPLCRSDRRGPVVWRLDESQEGACPSLDRRACDRALALSVHGQTSTTVVGHPTLSNRPARHRSARSLFCLARWRRAYNLV